MIRELIQSRLAEMSKSHKKLAEFVLDNSTEVSFMTLAEFSNETDISEATIVRFCRLLDFDGFPEFRVAMQMQIRKNISPTIKIKETVKRIQDNEDLCTNLINIDRTMLNKAADNISEKRIQTAAEKIDSGGKIYLAGIGISKSVAAFLELRLLRMKYPVISIIEGGDEIINKLLGATKDDVFIGIGFIRPRKELIAGFRIAAEKGMTRIVITNSETTRLTELAEIALYANRGPAEIMTSLAVPMTLVNMLTMELALRNKEKTVEAFNELDKLKRKFDL